jgi:hypothetical protein
MPFVYYALLYLPELQKSVQGINKASEPQIPAKCKLIRAALLHSACLGGHGDDWNL